MRHCQSAFAALYVIWGSTYLGIKFSIETIPPFLMAGARFVLAGLIMYAIAWSQGIGKSSWRNWRTSFMWMGLAGGFGGVGILFGPGLHLHSVGGRNPAIGISILLVTSFIWSAGSLYSRAAKHAASPFLTACLLYTSPS